MAQLGRPGLSASPKTDAWQQWKLGQSLSDIGRALGKHAGSTHRVVSGHGGIIPPPRRPSRMALTLSEHEEISRGIAADLSMRQMATRIGRPPSQDGWGHLTAVIDCHNRGLIGYEFALRGRAKEAERTIEAACLPRFGTLRPGGSTPGLRSDNGLIF